MPLTLKAAHPSKLAYARDILRKVEERTRDRGASPRKRLDVTPWQEIHSATPPHLATPNPQQVSALATPHPYARESEPQRERATKHAPKQPLSDQAIVAALLEPGRPEIKRGRRAKADQAPTLQSLKPWQQAGITRRGWYMRMKRQRVAKMNENAA